MASKRLKRAIAERKVVVFNNSSGEANVFLVHNDKKFVVTIPGKTEVELAPLHCDPKEISKSPNLESLLRGPLRLR